MAVWSVMEPRHKNPHAQAAGIAIAHTIHGAPVEDTVRPEMDGAAEGRIQQVPQAHMRNYTPPKRRSSDNPDKELCSYEGCAAWPSKRYAPYCAGHAVTMGLRENPIRVAKERGTVRNQWSGADGNAD